MVTRGNEVVYSKAFGLADLEHDVPNRTTTIFECGSVSKQFTAMAALLLVKEGKAKLDDDIRKYIPELPVYEAPIRIQHLLNHTSGLKDWGSIGAISGWPRTTRVYTNELALQIICRQKSTNFKPGNEYYYSNSNYTLLVTLVERLSGQSLSDFTTERLFKPAGMNQTLWRDDFREIVPGRAIAYGKSGGKYEQVMPFENVHGHGGLLTTTADLTKWNELLVTHAIGGDDVYAMRIKQGKLNNGTTISYASGISVNKYNNLVEISHSGATAAYRAYLLAYPEKKLSIAIISNDGSFNAPSAGNAIAQIFLGKRSAGTPPAPCTAAPPSSDRLQQWSGVYRSIRHFEVSSFQAEGAQITLNGRTLAVADSETLCDDETKWILLKPGRIMRKTASDTTTFVRMTPSDTSPKALQQYEGVYTSDEADCSFRVELRGNDLYLVNRPFPAIALQSKYLDGFQIDGYDLVQFFRNTKGAIVGFDMSVSRAERVPFRRTNQSVKP